MIENLVIFVIFSIALAYLGNMVWKQFSTKNTAGCAKGCGACGNIDFNKIEQQMVAKEKKSKEKMPM